MEKPANQITEVNEKALTVLEARDLFLREKEKELLIKKGSVSPETLRQYGYHIDHLLDYLVRTGNAADRRGAGAEARKASLKVRDIATSDIENYLVWHMRKGGSQATLSTELYSFRSFWKVLKGKGWVEVDIAAPIERKAQKYQEAPHLKEKHIKLFQDYLSRMDEGDPLSFRNKVLFSLICKFGCRITEALTLRRRDLSVKAEEVVCTFRGKGSKLRTLPLPLLQEGTDSRGRYLPSPIPGHIAFAELLHRYFELPTGLRAFLDRSPKSSEPSLKADRKASKESPYIFMSSRARRLSDDMARIEFHRIMVDLGLEGYGYTPHSLRHTAATNWLRSEVDLKTVSELLGHASVITTGTIYAHSEAQKLRRGLSKSL